MSTFAFPLALCNCRSILKTNCFFPRILFNNKCQYKIRLDTKETFPLPSYIIEIDTDAEIFNYICMSYYKNDLRLPQNIKKLTEIFRVTRNLGIKNMCLINSLLQAIMSQILNEYTFRYISYTESIKLCCDFMGYDSYFDESLFTVVIKFILNDIKLDKKNFTLEKLGYETLNKLIRYGLPHKFKIPKEQFTISKMDGLDFVYTFTEKEHLMLDEIDYTNNDSCADITIILSDKHKIKINSMILYQYSYYFKGLLEKNILITVFNLSQKMKSNMENIDIHLFSLFKGDFNSLINLNIKILEDIFTILNFFDMDYLYVSLKNVIPTYTADKLNLEIKDFEFEYGFLLPMTRQEYLSLTRKKTNNEVSPELI